MLTFYRVGFLVFLPLTQPALSGSWFLMVTSTVQSLKMPRTPKNVSSVWLSGNSIFRHVQIWSHHVSPWNPLHKANDHWSFQISYPDLIMGFAKRSYLTSWCPKDTHPRITSSAIVSFQKVTFSCLTTFDSCPQSDELFSSLNALCCMVRPPGSDVCKHHSFFTSYWATSRTECTVLILCLF